MPGGGKFLIPVFILTIFDFPLDGYVNPIAVLPPSVPVLKYELRLSNLSRSDIPNVNPVNFSPYSSPSTRVVTLTWGTNAF